jgi:hypothetical protein
MPKTKRQFLKRYLAHAHSNVWRAEEHLAALEATFATTHTDYAEFLTLMIHTLEEVRLWMQQFATHAWGSCPDDFETWRNLRDKGKMTDD